MTNWQPKLAQLFATPKTITEALDVLAESGEFPDYRQLQGALKYHASKKRVIRASRRKHETGYPIVWWWCGD